MHLCRERGHHRRPPQRHLPQTLRRPTTSNSVTASMPRPCGWREDTCRTLAPAACASWRASRGAAREPCAKRALARRAPRRRSRTGPRARRSPVRRPTSRSTTCCARDCAPPPPITAGCRRKAPTMPRGSASPGLDRRSDRRHPRLLAGHEDGASAWRWSRIAARCWRRSSCRSAMKCSLPRAAQGATLNDRRFGDPRHRAGFFPRRRAEAAGAASKPVISRRLRCIRESDHWRCGCAGSRRAALMRRLPAARAATGTLPRPI